MSEVVFILGAGASAHAGTPIMKDFYEKACDLYGAGKFDKKENEWFEIVKSAKESLERILPKLNFDVSNIEKLFSLIEMGKLINRFPGYEKKPIDELHEAIQKVIVRTIELSTEFKIGMEGVAAPEIYTMLADKVLLELERQRRPGISSVLTFNYDVAIDLAIELVSGHKSINYCLPEKDANDLHSGYKLLKLHGSLNWARYKQGERTRVIPVSIWDFVEKSGMSRRLTIPKKEEIFHIDVGTKINKLKWPLDPDFELSAIGDIPLIVPPTWNKTEYHSILSNVWAQAAKEISEAKYIFIIGYSLPPSDLFFECLLALGMLNIYNLKRFWVYDLSKEVQGRYKRLIGATVRDKFEVIGSPFSSDVIGRIMWALQMDKLLA